MSRLFSLSFFLLVAVALCVSDMEVASGQDRAAAMEAAKARARARGGPKGGPPAKPPGSGEAKPGAKPGDKSGEKKNKDGEKEEKPSVVKRPDKPPTEPSEDELNVEPDDDGLIAFNFRYQPWPAVLDWLARVSNMSLDWQELPSGFLNLSTQRPYTIEQTRDSINRHLLLRGFTMLENDDLLSVSKIATLDVGMVPRVSAKDLESFAKKRPHAFVKVSFELDWMLAAEAVEELKPMLSPNHKLSALSKTNRVEAMDAARNLRDVLRLLNAEQSDVGQERLVRQFILQHVRAAEVKTQLEELLGLESKGDAAAAGGGGRSGNNRQMQQLQQQIQQMQQQQRNQNKNAGAAPKEEAKVRLVVNQRKNSILANAPPDKMAVISQAVTALDVKTNRSDSVLDRRYKIEVYRLRSMDPAALAKTLEDLGDLDPVTRLEVDSVNKSLIVSGSVLDHAMIRQLLDRLDGSTRKFEVVRLRNLPADYVAGTIQFMMVGEDDQGPGIDSYYYYRYGAGSQQQSKEDEFRVDADVENNLLLLWASEPEIESVMDLLIKIGERPPEGGDRRTLRVLDSIPPEQAAEFIRKLREAWPMLGPNQLNLPEVKEEEVDEEPEPARSKKTTEARWNASSPHTVFVQLSERSAAEADPAAEEVTEDDGADLLQRYLDKQRARKEQESGPAPKIDVSIGADGRVIIRSDDTKALDLLEELIGQVSPLQNDFEIFYMVYADAYWVKDNLVEFFEEKKEETSNSRYPFYYYGGQNEKKEERSRLSQRRELKFIYDLDTNSILVQGGDPHQLRTVKQLIEIYDKPPPTDSKSARLTSVFPVKFSKAQVIADTIKDVYRDLLSSTDKALAGGNPEKKNRENAGTTIVYGGSTDNEPDRTQIRFKGKLSIGVDSLTNTLLISCEGENLMANVSQMVKTLDRAAQPLATVSTIKLNGGLNAAKVSEVLGNLLLEKKGSPAKPEGGQPGQNGGNKQNRNNNNNDGNQPND